MFNSTVAWISFRALFGRRRALLFALPAAILVLITLALKGANGTVQDWPAIVLGRVGAGAVVPLTALLVGTSVLGSEIDDNSVLHLLATPVPRRAVILSKTAVSAAVTFLFAALPVLIAGVIAQSGVHALSVGCFLGATLGSVVYSCLFVMISAALRHPVIYALAYVALWEELISNLVSGAKYLSIEQWSLGLAHSVSKSGDLNAHLTITPSLVLAAIAVVVLLGYGTRRLSAFTVRAD